MIVFLRDIYKYKEMLKNLVRKDLRTRYRGTFLGFIWTFVNPILMLTIYSLVFPYILRVKEQNYAMFVFVALLPWIYFSTAVQTSSMCILSNADLVKKVYFPRQIIPLSVVTGATVNFLLGSFIVLLSLFIFKIDITIYALIFPVIVLIQYIMTAAMCFIVSSLNVYYRDLSHILEIVLTAWFYLTPILYPLDILPKHLSLIIKLNPLTHIFLAYRDVLYYGRFPNLNSMVGMSIFTVALLMVSIAVFNKMQKRFAEEI